VIAEDINGCVDGLDLLGENQPILLVRHDCNRLRFETAVHTNPPTFPVGYIDVLTLEMKFTKLKMTQRN